MKQHITLKQLKELRKPQLHILYRWCLDKKYVENVEEIDWVRSDMCLSIGQMIEFIVEHTNRAEDTLAIDAGEHQWRVYTLNKPKNHTRPELCDALWEAVKDTLENS